MKLPKTKPESQFTYTLRGGGGSLPYHIAAPGTGALRRLAHERRGVEEDGGWRMADGGWRMADGERLGRRAFSLFALLRPGTGALRYAGERAPV